MVRCCIPAHRFLKVAKPRLRKQRTKSNRGKVWDAPRRMEIQSRTKNKSLATPKEVRLKGGPRAAPGRADQLLKRQFWKRIDASINTSTTGNESVCDVSLNTSGSLNTSDSAMLFPTTPRMNRPAAPKNLQADNCPSGPIAIMTSKDFSRRSLSRPPRYAPQVAQPLKLLCFFCRAPLVFKTMNVQLCFPLRILPCHTSNFKCMYLVAKQP